MQLDEAKAMYIQSNLHLTASTHIFRVIYLITQVVFLEVIHVICLYQGMVWLQGKGQTHRYMCRKLQWVSWWWSWGEVPLNCSAMFCSHSWGQGSVQSRDKADVKEDSYCSTQQLYKASTPFFFFIQTLFIAEISCIMHFNELKIFYGE